MLRTEVLEIIANGENSGVEFKRDSIRPEEFAREAVAFANFQGGRILLGVEDDGSISGLQRDNTQEWVLNAFRDKIHPQIIPFYEEIELGNMQKIAIVSVSSGISKPYVCVHNRREDIYVRIGNQTELATREQQMRLFESGGLLHVEVMPVPGTSLDCLDMERMEYYLKNILSDPEIPSTRHEWIERLQRMGFMNNDGLGNTVCSIAGLLCFGINPRQYLPQSGLRVMSFFGEDKEYKAQLDVVLDGPLIKRLRKLKSGQQELVDEGLIEKFASMIEPFITEEASTIDKDFRREKTWIYPWEAVRETVVNALAHRDWTRSVDIEITNYSNRIEIISPGRFQNSMDIEKMIAGQRSYRNSLIMGVLRDYAYVDERGMGVRTKVIPSMRSLNKTDPVFEATDDYIKTILPRKKAGAE
jgi:ATP-dependent DNA helicase RecG